MKKIFLASASPRRKQILEQLSIPFTYVAQDVDETTEDAISPLEEVRLLARRKATAAVAHTDGDGIILGADTIVAFQGKKMGKPKDPEDAFQILNRLQGQKHSVYTGMALLLKEQGQIVKETTLVASAEVWMKPLTPEEINAYIRTGEPMDKAGAYGIQEKGGLFIEKIQGDLYAVIGLSVAQLNLGLQEMGVQITDLWQ